MIVISQALVLSPAELALPGRPLIGWRNVVTPSGIVASASTESGFPASNLANPATHREWRSAGPVDQYMTVTTDGITPIDYLAVAKHNFGSARISVGIEGLIDGVWTTMVTATLMLDDTPLLFRFPPVTVPQVRMLMLAGIAAPRAAVVYVGALLVVERRLYVGHTPLPHARKSTITNGRSESGNFLGRIQTGASRETTASFRLISPGWYRANMDEFLSQEENVPFFFAWRPNTYPREVGYAWLINDPMPVPQDAGSGNLLAFDLVMSGIT